MCDTCQRLVFRARTYDEWRQGMIMRRKQLGMPQRALDEKAGLADGHVEKIETGRRTKNLGPLSLTLLLGALGLEMQVVCAASTTDAEIAKSFALFKAFCHARALKAARIRIARMTPHQRRRMTLAARRAKKLKDKAKRGKVRP